MKRIYSLLVLLAGIAVFAACDDDRDSNPVLQKPSSFVLNVPGYANAIYDLKNTETVVFTCSQPDYGFTAPTTYSVQISTVNDFATEGAYATLSTTSTKARIEADAAEMAVALVGLLGVDEEENFPKDPFKLYVRLKASLTGDVADVYSNVIELPNVLSYFALDPMVMPTEFYIIGSICDWQWTKAYSMVPIHSNEGKFWSVQYLPEGAEIKFNTVTDWDGGEFGYAADRFPESSVNYAGIEDGGGNIKITNGGWYIVVVTTVIEGRDYNYTVEFLPPNVYLTGNTAGGWDFFDETNLFTVPADGEGAFESPAFVASDELRMCIKLDGIDWWKTEFLILNDKIEYRGTGGDQERVVVSAGKKAYLYFLKGEGEVK